VELGSWPNELRLCGALTYLWLRPAGLSLHPMSFGSAGLSPPPWRFGTVVRVDRKGFGLDGLSLSDWLRP